MDSPALLSVYERCNRLGIWCRDWEKSAPDANEMLQRAIMAGLTTDGKNHGQIAGEECFSMGPTCGLQTCATSVHDQVVHLSSLGDILVTALRKPQEGPWMPAGEVQLGEGPIWVSNAFLNQSGDQLRRIVTVSAWNDDRHFHECRTWASLGEVCAFNLPMKIGICVVGPRRDGKHHGHWTQAYRHPVNRTIKFRKKNNPEIGFKSSWERIWREDFDEISTTTWLEAMLGDGILPDVCFAVDLPVPAKEARQEILDLAARRLEEIWTTRTLPGKQLSTCDWPSVCPHRGHCMKGDPPSGRYGFVKIG